MKKKLFQNASSKILNSWTFYARRKTSRDSSTTQLETQKTPTTKKLLTSNFKHKLTPCRYPFVATDILTSCMRIADRMIEEKVQNGNQEDNDDMPSLEI
jgi:hypothetical protein